MSRSKSATMPATASAPGENGEICLRGPKVTQGYWKDPAKTASAFFGDWFRTGDVGYLDEDGFLYLTDRKKDMIISGGENIASSEVERVIYELPQVREVAVIGMPRRALGRDAGRDRRARRWRRACAARTHRALPRAPRRLQGAEATDHPRQPAAKPFRQRSSSACCAPNSRHRHDTSRIRQGDKAQPRRAQRLDQAKDLSRPRQRWSANTAMPKPPSPASPKQAGVAQGTFYNHFENRQELLDQLLPKIGIDMVRFIRDRT